MRVSGVVVRANPATMAEVSRRLVAIPGVQIHGDSPDGHVVLTVEDGIGYSTEDSLLQVHIADGVLSASLVYQYCDDGLENREAEQ
jgi:nitrate reductase NapD